MSNLVLAHLPEHYLTPLVDEGTAQLSLDRWCEIFDEVRAKDAVDDLKPLVEALKRISTKNASIEKGPMAAAAANVASVNAALGRLKDLVKFEQHSNGTLKQPLQLKQDVRHKFKNIIRDLRNDTNALGACFGLDPTQLGTLYVSTRGIRRQKAVIKKALKPPPPKIVTTDPDEFDKLAKAISALAGALPEDYDISHIAKETLEAQVTTIDSCALSVELMTEKFSAHPNLVDEHLVVPAFERAHAAVGRIAQVAAEKASLGPAIDELIESVDNLAGVHQIEDSNEIHLPSPTGKSAKKRAAQRSAKRAREESVAKVFHFGRWGAMSERRADIYELL